MPRLIDLHCDTIYRMYGDSNSNMTSNDYNVDIEKLVKANSFVQCFALFNHVKKRKNMYKNMLDFLDFYMRTISVHDKLNMVNKFSQIKQNRDNGKISIILSIEDTGPVDGHMDRVIDLYNRGARIIGFTWNYANCFGYPNSKKPSIMKRGLTDFGMEAVKALNDLGVIIDISHLSDGGARDVLKLSRMPVMATHSNARAITKVSRNLPDELIRSLADGGGAIGVNFFANFLGKGDGNSASSVDNMLRHIKHIVNVGGIDCMAIGTDFDGIPYEGIQIEDISQIHKLDDGLVKAGFSAAYRDKIFYKNALRVFSDVLR